MRMGIDSSTYLQVTTHFLPESLDLSLDHTVCFSLESATDASDAAKIPLLQYFTKNSPPKWIIS